MRRIIEEPEYFTRKTIKFTLLQQRIFFSPKYTAKNGKSKSLRALFGACFGSICKPLTSYAAWSITVKTNFHLVIYFYSLEFFFRYDIKFIFDYNVQSYLLILMNVK